MPELPEVETVKRELEQVLIGRRIKAIDVQRLDPIKPLTAELFCEQLEGQTFRQILRRGKYLLFGLNPPLWMIGHLRMTGKFVISSQKTTLGKHARVIFRLDQGEQLSFEDVRCFGTLKLVESLTGPPLMSQLGLEPLSAEFTASSLKPLLKTSKRPIKNFLLDQTQIAGLGNIYVSEILFRIGVSPLRPAQKLKSKEIAALIAATRLVLESAIANNGTSISDFRRVDDKTGEFQNFLKVYGKENSPCENCQSPILRIVQQQRSTFYCTHCQI